MATATTTTMTTTVPNVFLTNSCAFNLLNEISVPRRIPSDSEVNNEHSFCFCRNSFFFYFFGILPEKGEKRLSYDHRPWKSIKTADEIFIHSETASAYSVFANEANETTSYVFRFRKSGEKKYGKHFEGKLVALNSQYSECG